MFYVPTGPAAPTAPACAGEPGAADARADALRGLLAQLQAVTTRYVGTLRSRGARPEQMLRRVKALVREAMPAQEWLDPAAQRALTDAVVRWSIAAYHEPTPTGDRPVSGR